MVEKWSEELGREDVREDVHRCVHRRPLLHRPTPYSPYCFAHDPDLEHLGLGAAVVLAGHPG